MIAFLASAFAGVTLETPPVVGTETVVEVVAADGEVRSGETVRVVHRPGLGGEHELAVGITDGRGRVRWTPRSAGVAWLRAGDERVPVRVEGDTSTPVAALLLALLALGGAGALGYGLVGRRS